MDEKTVSANEKNEQQVNTAELTDKETEQVSGGNGEDLGWLYVGDGF